MDEILRIEEEEDIVKRKKSESLTCTCPKASAEVSKEASKDSLQNENKHKGYYRSISLGQILDPKPSGYESSDSTRKRRQRKRELSNFEKDNLLFLKELKKRRKDQQKYLEKQVRDLPYLSFAQRQNLQKSYGGNRGHLTMAEFPATAYYPSQTIESQILRSVSLEEPEISFSTSSESSENNYPHLCNGYANDYNMEDNEVAQYLAKENHSEKIDDYKNTKVATEVYPKCKTEEPDWNGADIFTAIFREYCQDTTQRPVHETKKPKESERNEIISTKPPTAPPASPSLPDKKTMAFTVDIGDSAASDSSGGSANKKLDISGPIAQFAPKHKRNLSQGKVDDKKSEDKQGEKPPVGRPRSGTIGATGGRRGGYHSEGYFSSDQEDELNKRGELKSPRSTGLPSVTRSSSGESPKSNTLRVRPDSPSNTYTVPLTESANFLIERMLTATPETKRKQNGKPEGRTCCKERKPSLPESTGRGKSQEKANLSKAYSEDYSKEIANFLENCKDDKDDASDTGTYTIDNSPEVEEARNNIDRVFGVIQESEAELTSSTAIPNSTDAGAEEDCWLSASENLNPTVSSTLSRNHPNWIEEWAYQVAEQTKPAMELPQRSSMSPRMHHANSTSDGERPRRKLPTVPPQYKSSHEQFEATSPKSPKPRPSPKDGFRHFEPESGDSDLDFARLSCTDDERLAATLKNKLKLSGITSSSPKKLPSPTPNRRYPPPDRLLAESFDERVEEPSDSSSETSEPYKESIRSLDNNPPLKFNRAFSLRRARLGYDAPQPQPEKKKISRPTSAGAKSTPSRYLSDSSVSSAKSFGYGKSNVVNFGRNDGGRYSLRLSGSQVSQGVVKSASKTNIQQKTTKKNPRSNSTLTSKEVDFQNWKRRKNYDPMKAAAEGRKKLTEKKTSKNTEQNDNSDNQSPHNSLHRSASFHGTNGAVPDLRWNNKMQHSLHYTSEEDGPLSLEEDVPRRLSSPLRRSPTSPNQLYSPKKHQYNPTPARPFRPQVEPKQVPPHFQVPRKVSMDESGSEGKRSPLNSQGSGRRPKAKMEALDNLVISTIHSLSVKVRTTAESLLLKLKSQYDEEGERAALLQEVLLHLSESDQSGASQTRSTSRELAGILRNLKKVEQSLQVIDRVLVTGEYLDEDDIPNDWGESDY